MNKNLTDKINKAKVLLEECLLELSQQSDEPKEKQHVSVVTKQEKKLTLRELVKDRKFKNGQEQVAVVVGYNEKKLKQLINKDKIKDEWSNAKMDGAFSPVYFSRAKNTLIRVHPDNTCDLTQTGEEFFENLLNEDSK
jgi:hypothetical protein